ncbi:hypothetical protein ABZY36_38620 [Streptomyces sp. NPDC006627]|uniref:hypothetical protein n=1 Tax=Streptomyces sp. NPDC006627 TaxID=3154679 RepID=UPI0033B6CF7D
MHDTRPVGVSQGINHVACDAHRHTERKTAVLVQHIGQRLARYQLHDEIGKRPALRVLADSEVVHRDDVGARQRRSCPGLSSEPASSVCVILLAAAHAGSRFPQGLHGHSTSEPFVVRPPDGAHATLAAYALIEAVARGEGLPPPGVVTCISPCAVDNRVSLKLSTQTRQYAIRPSLFPDSPGDGSHGKRPADRFLRII